MMIGGANTEETDNAVSDAADPGKVLQENGQHGVAREVAKLESKLRAASNAEDLVQNREQEHSTLESRAMAPHFIGIIATPLFFLRFNWLFIQYCRGRSRWYLSRKLAISNGLL